MSAATEHHALMHPAIDFEQVLDRSPNPYMLLTPELRYAWANEAYLQATSRRLDEIVGQYLFDAFPGDDTPSGHAGTQMLRQSLERVLARRRPDTLALIRYAIPRETPDGTVLEERFWSATHTPVFDEHGEVAYILQHTVDVTELQALKTALRDADASRESPVPSDLVESGVLGRARVVQEANRNLEAERREMRRLFQQAPGFIAILRGPDHVFQLCNDAYYRLVGRRDIVGKPVREALPEIEGQGFFQLLDRVYNTAEPFVGRAVRVLLDRHAGEELEELYIDFVYQPVVEHDGSVSGIFVQGNDVTAQIRAQAELRELNASLERRVAERTAELEARNRELQEYAYVVSHDLQEPLRKVHMFADLLVEEHGGSLDEEGRAYLHRIMAGTRRMSTLIKALLDYSRVSTRSSRLQRVDLNEAVAEVLADLQVRLEETGGRVDVGALPSIHADPAQMLQLFQNLIGNGLKFHRPGVAPVVSVQAVLETSGRRRICRIEVRDNGIGFDPQHAARIFTPFQRLHPRERYEGTGIGLAICRRIAERHGGTIRAESRAGDGATFIVELPVATAAPAPLAL